MMMSPYLRLARIDNWSKNLLVALGALVASAMSGSLPAVSAVLLVLLAACFSSSANYVLNESLDARTDAHHPLKKSRAAVAHDLDRRVVCAEYALLAAAALVAASAVGQTVALVVAVHVACAWLYNIPPVRFKDVAYADVLLESINYPLRFLMGWLSVLPLFPPSSLLMVSWAAGGFAMALKRYAELHLFPSRDEAALYRRSYAHYTKDGLMASAFVYAMVSVLGGTVLLLKYKIELILLAPLCIGLLAWYQFMAQRASVLIVYPERLVYSRIFLLLTVAIVLASIILLHTDVPALKELIEPVSY